MAEHLNPITKIRNALRRPPQPYYSYDPQLRPEWAAVLSSRRELNELAKSAPTIPIFPEIPLVKEPTRGSDSNPLSTREVASDNRHHLYKGLQPSAFKYYFQSGGISPRVASKDYPWITTNLTRAIGHAGVDIERTCLAVIDKNVMERGNLKYSRDATSLLSGNFADIYGDEEIGWHEILGVITSPSAVNEIYFHYTQLVEPSISWNELAPKIALVPPRDEKAIIDTVNRFK